MSKRTNGPIVIERTFLQSEAFRSLNGTAKNVFFDFRMKCQLQKIKGTSGRKDEWLISNNGKIEYTYSEAEKKGIARATFMRSIDALLEKGLIDIAYQGQGGRKGDKSLYAISNRWEMYGTDKFEQATRPKDLRGGRGFKPGKNHWTKTNIGIKSDN